MDFTPLAWHWLIFGIILIVAEIFMPSFTILWFGLGACIVAACKWLLPDMTLTWELAVWIVASSSFAVLWFKFFKPTMVDRTRAGIAKEAILGESGSIIKLPAAGGRGIVRFTTPVLGNDEWQFICDEEIAIGDRVFVKNISGNTLIVTKNPA